VEGSKQKTKTTSEQINTCMRKWQTKRMKGYFSESMATMAMAYVSHMRMTSHEEYNYVEVYNLNTCIS
jgi:hypothetical protein